MIVPPKVFFFRMRNVSEKIVRKIGTHIFYSINTLRNSCRLKCNGSGSLREDCTHGRHQEIGVDMLDYILVNHSFRKRVKEVQSLPGADIDSNHNLLFAEICTRLKKII